MSYWQANARIGRRRVAALLGRWVAEVVPPRMVEIGEASEALTAASGSRLRLTTLRSLALPAGPLGNVVADPQRLPLRPSEPDAVVLHEMVETLAPRHQVELLASLAVQVSHVFVVARIETRWSRLRAEVPVLDVLRFLRRCHLDTELRLLRREEVRVRDYAVLVAALAKPQPDPPDADLVVPPTFLSPT